MTVITLPDHNINNTGRGACSSSRGQLEEIIANCTKSTSLTDVHPIKSPRLSHPMTVIPTNTRGKRRAKCMYLIAKPLNKQMIDSNIPQHSKVYMNMCQSNHVNNWSTVCMYAGSATSSVSTSCSTGLAKLMYSLKPAHATKKVASVT